MSSIYIHFPYCLYKCHYCDFNSYATDVGKIPYAFYRDALIQEMKFRSRFFQDQGFGYFPADTKIKTIFFGGGTPSLMPASDVAALLTAIKDYFVIETDCEITLEANPGTINQHDIEAFQQAGINRISIGVQSLNEKYLSQYGRIHSADQARQVLTWLAQSGLRSWNADLIFGFPGQTMPEWRDTLDQVLSFDPPHLSCYSFTVEPDAPYGRWVAAGRALVPDDEIQTDMLLYTRQQLEAAGYQSYEVSNFARPGFECRHNLAYWNYGDYLGIGAGAVGMQQLKAEEGFVVRTSNFKNPDAYQKAVFEGRSCFDLEWVDKKTVMIEFLMMNFRKKHGVTMTEFELYFNEPIPDHIEHKFDSFIERGLMQRNPYRLTEKGLLFSNQILADII